MKYDKHIFICTNDRGDNSTRQSCGRRGGLEIRKEFVRLVNEHGLKGKVRANKSGCLDMCDINTRYNNRLLEQVELRQTWRSRDTKRICKTS